MNPDLFLPKTTPQKVVSSRIPSSAALLPSEPSWSCPRAETVEQSRGRLKEKRVQPSLRDSLPAQSLPKELLDDISSSAPRDCPHACLPCPRSGSGGSSGCTAGFCSPSAPGQALPRSHEVPSRRTLLPLECRSLLSLSLSVPASPVLRGGNNEEVTKPQRSAQGRIWAGLYYSTGRVPMATQGTASAGSGAGRSCTDLLEWFIVCLCHVESLILTLPGEGGSARERLTPTPEDSHWDGAMPAPQPCCSEGTWALPAPGPGSPCQSWPPRGHVPISDCYQHRIMIKPEAQTEAEQVWPLEAGFFHFSTRFPVVRKGSVSFPSSAPKPEMIEDNETTPAMEFLGTAHLGGQQE